MAFADPQLKEIAFVGRRIHLLYRLSEGRRGMHVLFREPVFDDVRARERLLALVDTMRRLERSAARPAQA